MSLPTNQNDADKIIKSHLIMELIILIQLIYTIKGKMKRLSENALKNNRQEIILATKVGNRVNAYGDGWSWDPSKKWITTCG